MKNDNSTKQSNASKPMLCDACVEKADSLGFSIYEDCGCKVKFEITYQINEDVFTNKYCGTHKNKLISWIKRRKFFHEVKSIA
jgi:hypothetical protein